MGQPDSLSGMTALTPAASARPLLIDRLVPRSIVTDAVLVTASVVLVSLAAQLVIPLQPVPFTAQTFAVLLVGAVVGPARGAVSMLLYGLLGVLGAPVFSHGSHGISVLFGATGGYIVGFVVAAPIVGWFASRAWDRNVLRTIVAFAAGTVVIYAIGLPWLFVVLSLGGDPAALSHTLAFGLLPFLVGDALKALVAGLLLPAAWKGVGLLHGGSTR